MDDIKNHPPIFIFFGGGEICGKKIIIKNNKGGVNMEKYQTLKDLVKFNTIKDKENNQIIDYIQNKLKKMDLKQSIKLKY